MLRKTYSLLRFLLSFVCTSLIIVVILKFENQLGEETAKRLKRLHKIAKRLKGFVVHIVSYLLNKGIEKRSPRLRNSM